MTFAAHVFDRVRFYLLLPIYLYFVIVLQLKNIR